MADIRRFRRHRARSTAAMDYNQYMNSRDLSWRVLIDRQIARLPISISEACSALGIAVRSYAQAKEAVRVLGLERVCSGSDGLSFVWNRAFYILYNSDRPPQRIRFTIAHELGHCLLHHCEPGYARPPLHVSVCENTRALERQADTFAADLLAPACVLWGLGVTTAEEIAAYCNISLAAGRIRLGRLQALVNRNAGFLRTRGHGCFLLSPLEQRVYGQFSSYIQEMRINPKNR